MKQFFKFMFASMLGSFLLMFIAIIIFVTFLVAALSSVQSTDVTVKDNSVLSLKLEGTIYDRSPNNPLENFDFGTMKSNVAPGLSDILYDINYAATDDHIKGIYIELSSIDAGSATIEEIRNALLEFKKSGKFIIAYSEEYSQSAYYLATVADRLYINPEGTLEFKGLSAQLVFLKGLMQKIAVQPQIIRHGKFKSAVEPLIEDKMSPANREQTSRYVMSLWEQMTKGISGSRRLSVEQLNLVADSLLVTGGTAALQFKLVDGVKYKNEVLDELRDRLKLESEDKISFITLKKYNKAIEGKRPKALKDKIAVIYAQGDIVMGDGDDKTVGSERYARALRQARNDSSVKAVVLRVNSPGGSALASEVIWKEVVLTKKQKPVVVSMGDLAASGGYYIACAATRILASPNTLTGSIGVFGVVPNTQKLFNEKLGVTFDGVSTNKHSDHISIFRPLDTYETAVVQKDVEHIYSIFIRHVAEGRKMTLAQVDSIGQGRVWSGADAKKIGLVDEFGGLNDAIRQAAKLAGIEKYSLTEYPRLKDPFTEFMNQLQGNESKMMMLEEELGPAYSIFREAKSVLELRGVQARIPYQIMVY